MRRPPTWIGRRQVVLRVLAVTVALERPGAAVIPSAPCSASIAAASRSVTVDVALRAVRCSTTVSATVSPASRREVVEDASVAER